jgi:hypothetical protein
MRQESRRVSDALGSVCLETSGRVPLGSSGPVLGSSSRVQFSGPVLGSSSRIQLRPSSGPKSEAQKPLLSSTVMIEGDCSVGRCVLTLVGIQRPCLTFARVNEGRGERVSGAWKQRRRRIKSRPIPSFLRLVPKLYLQFHLIRGAVD